MPADASRCSNRACHITGYSVSIAAGDVTGTVELVLIDSCNTLHDACRAKAILVKVYKDWLENQDESTEVLASCRDNFKCVGGGPGFTYYHGTHTLVVETTVSAPGELETVTVPLPLTCDNVFA